jgi:hypothetical protein
MPSRSAPNQATAEQCSGEAQRRPVEGRVEQRNNMKNNSREPPRSQIFRKDRLATPRQTSIAPKRKDDKKAPCHRGPARFSNSNNGRVTAAKARETTAPMAPPTDAYPPATAPMKASVAIPVGRGQARPASISCNSACDGLLDRARAKPDKESVEQEPDASGPSVTRGWDALPLAARRWPGCFAASGRDRSRRTLARQKPSREPLQKASVDNRGMMRNWGRVAVQGLGE